MPGVDETNAAQSEGGLASTSDSPVSAAHEQ